MGVPEKRGVFAWCFCGEFVVDCVINVVRKMADLWGGKHATFCNFIFGAHSGSTLT
jgi:hypothetical protein